MKKFALVLAVLLAACFRTQALVPSQPETTLRVQNQAFLDMNIYLVRGSESVRLGTATGLSTTVFKIPQRVLTGQTGLRFRADPIGGNRLPISEETTVTPGDEVNIVIPAN